MSSVSFGSSSYISISPAIFPVGRKCPVTGRYRQHILSTWMTGQETYVYICIYIYRIFSEEELKELE